MRFLEELMAGEIADDPGRLVLRLLGPPHVSALGAAIEIPESCKRLLAFIALRGSCVDRRLAAGFLWPDGDNRRAGGSLRTALWRLNSAPLPLVVACNPSLEISPKIAVDLHVVSAWAARLTANRPRPEDLQLDPPDIQSLELLPGWYDDWALLERERFRHRVFHGLEALSRRLCDQGLNALAVDTAITVVSADPLRESAQRVLIEAYVAEGNLVEARRSYVAYRQRLRQELDVEPAPELTALVSPARSFEVRPRQSTASFLSKVALSQ